MKILLLLLTLTVTAAAQCENESMPYPKSGALAKETFSINVAEGSIRLDASTLKTSWAEKGSEAAVVTVFVDGKYHQDVVLFIDGEDLPAAKTDRHAYDLFLGELPKGEHKVEVFFNPRRSAPIGKPAVRGLQLGWSQLRDYEMMRNAPKTSPEYSTFERFRARYLARANAPFLYARPNAVDKFTDIPLLTYYEVFDEPDGVIRVRYTTIFSNEDGGTRSKALMARWGRTVDIEWVYEMRIDKNGRIFDETYQGANHETKDFVGRREFGSHPVLYVATDNNNFSDTGCSPMRFATEAVEANLSGGSRETLMEKYPWLYKTMADEMQREGRIAPGGENPNTIDDPREYLYAEIYSEPEAAAITFEVRAANGKVFTSDMDRESFRVDRKGFVRIAVHLPPTITDEKIKEFSVRCHAADLSKNAECRNVRLLKVVRLDRRFAPKEKFFREPAKTLRNGQAATHPSGFTGRASTGHGLSREVSLAPTE